MIMVIMVIMIVVILMMMMVRMIMTVMTIITVAIRMMLIVMITIVMIITIIIYSDVNYTVFDLCATDKTSKICRNFWLRSLHTMFSSKLCILNRRS